MEKRTSPENKLALKRVLAQEGNGRCADCKTATHPRWASWNIGILICIRCSGIHRSLGTHISKVRSIDLDTWNDQQLEKLIAYGNTRANAYWEAKLKPGYVPDEAKIANFIKTKYELKRWIPEDDDTPLASVRPGLPPRVRGADAKTAGAPPRSTPAAASNPRTGQSVQPSAARITHSQPASVDLLDLDGAFNVRSKPTAAPAPAPALNGGNHSHNSPHRHQHHHHHHHHHLHLGRLHAHHDGRTAHSHESSPQPSFEPPPRPASQPPRSDIKKSILALYADKQTGQPVGRPPAASATTKTSSSTLSSSLAGLSFSNTPSAVPPSPQQQQQHHQSRSPASQQAPHHSALPLQTSRFDADFEDESFSNVWK